MSDSVFLTDGNGVITGLVDTAYSGALEIPEYVGNERIIGIGNEAFAGCYNLTSVTIPDSVISIGSGAFQFCTSLTSVYVSNPDNLSEAISSYDWSNTGSVVTFINPRPAYYIDYLIKGETLMGIADKIRVLSGTAAEMTPVEMQDKLDNLSTELSELGIVIDEQIDLIAQIMNALDGKVISIPSFNYKAIYFTIDGVYHIAEEGMTWEEWIASNYSDDIFFLAGSTVYRVANAVRYNDRKEVYSYEKILANYAYINPSAGGSND